MPPSLALASPSFAFSMTRRHAQPGEDAAAGSYEHSYHQHLSVQRIRACLTFDTTSGIRQDTEDPWICCLILVKTSLLLSLSLSLSLSIYLSIYVRAFSSSLLHGMKYYVDCCFPESVYVSTTVTVI